MFRDKATLFLVVILPYSFEENLIKRPAILSALYGYDGCLGSVNDFWSDKEYFQNLQDRNCTVIEEEDGFKTNVPKSYQLKFGCQTFSGLKWLDGIPLVFNFPLITKPDLSAIEIELSDGNRTNPVCLLLAPADEMNERDTMLLLGNFGNGALDTVRPARISLAGDVLLKSPDGEINARGLTYQNEDDMNYLTSSVRLVYARLWDVEQYPEETRHNLWPLPSWVYPNNCQTLFTNTTHVLRTAFSGGMTLDGIRSVRPDNKNIFKLTDDTGKTVEYLGLGDLGKTISVDEGEEYQQDGDNIIDICLDLTGNQDILEDLIVLELMCKEDENSVLYPPKGKPYGCKYQNVTITKIESFGNILMSWTYNYTTNITY